MRRQNGSFLIRFSVARTTKMKALVFSLLFAIGSNGLTLQSVPYCGPENDNAMYPNPLDCTTYYHCSFGIAHLMNCNPGLVWNAQLVTCDYPSKDTHCADATTSGPGPTSAAPQQPTTGAPELTTGAPQPTSGAPKPTTGAPQPTSGAPQPTTAAPQPTTAAPKPTTAPPPPPGDLSCPADADLIYYLVPGTCSNFYLCRDGAYVGTYGCQQGLNFSPYRQACVRPEKQPC